MKEKLPLDPNSEIFRWGPAPMKYYYVSDWEGIFTRFPLVFPGEYWPGGILISKGGTMVWVNDYAELRKCAQSVFLKFMLDKTGRNKVHEGWKKDLDSLQTWQRKVEQCNLSQLGEADFINLWEEMKEALLTFWTNIVIPELSNFGGNILLEEEVKKYVKNEIEVNSVMEILSAPEAPSFYQQEEIDLSNSSNIAEHTHAYFWLENSYNGASILGKNYFIERKNNLSPILENDFKKLQAQKRKLKEETKSKYRLSDYVMELAKSFIHGIEWQDERKKMIWIYIHYKNIMLDEAVRRLTIPKYDLLNFGTGEVLDILKDTLPAQNTITDRRKAFAWIIPVLKKQTVIGSKQALEYWDLLAEEKSTGNETELKGVVVSRSSEPVRGKIRVIYDPKESSDFLKGEILVAPMTTPDYVQVMKKASAIITDTGGLMSHAAVVSRELKIPCIVGTKIATQILKNGDMVEVDTANAKVAILKI